MTISIGLIPNNKTVMIIQDAEGSYAGLGFEQDIFTKIQDINQKAVGGVIGDPSTANETLDLLRNQPYNSGAEIRDASERAYHAIRERHFTRGVLSAYGLENMREVTCPNPNAPIDPKVKEEILRMVKNANSYPLSLMLASNYERPEIFTVNYPGVGNMFSTTKEYTAEGSGSILAIEKMGEELKNHRWSSELNNDEAINVLMRAGKASEKHTGVGGPFEIVYITKKEESTKIIRPDKRKINMGMYVLDHNLGELLMEEIIGKIRDEEVSAVDLADFIKSQANFGLEFNKYFGLKNGFQKKKE